MFVIHALVAVFALLVLVVGGSWLVVTRFQLHVTSAALHLPLGYVYSVLPISGALMVYYSVLFMFFEQKDA